MKRKLVLQNGMEFVGKGFGSFKECGGELVFNTSMVGYQEILSDPAYTDQMMLMTYPLIGNYGIIDEDYESKVFGPKALIVREYNDKPSNFRYTKTLNEWLEENDIPGITHIDTRQLTNIVREEGVMKVLLCDETVSHEEAMQKIAVMETHHDQVARVSCKKKWYSRCANPNYNVVAIDCGITYSTIRELNHMGCNVTIVPYNTSLEKLNELKPDGLFISDGPGNPSDVKEVIQLIQAVQGKLPMFGVSLGHQLIALANGLTIEKLKFGHHGGNHPIQNVDSKKVIIASQNHDYVVNKESAEKSKLVITHIDLLDQTVAGLRNEKEHLFSIQYHLDGAACPQDAQQCCAQFIEMMKEMKEKR